MKKRKLIPALALTLTLLCGITIGASASSTLQEIQAYLNYGITVKYNGEEQTIMDASGNRLYPITYNNTTYVPLRALSNIFGVAVDWDQATQTVLLGSQERTDLIASFKPYTSFVNKAEPYYSSGAVQFIQSTDKLKKEIGGITVDHWFTLYNRYATGEPYPTGTVTCSFNLEGKYNTLSFQAYSDKDTTLTVYGDNENILGQYKVKGGEVPQTYTVNLVHTRQLSFVRSPGMDLGGDVRDNNIYCYVFNAFVE